MKTFTAHFMYRDESGLQDEFLKLDCSSRAAATRLAKEVAKKNGWRLRQILTEKGN